MASASIAYKKRATNFRDNGRRLTISCLSDIRPTRRIIIPLLFTALLFLTYFHHQKATYNVEEHILRYLSLSSEEQARLHDHQLAALQAGLSKCANIEQRPVSVPDSERTNPRAVKGAPPILITHATLIDGDGSVLSQQELLLAEGTIKAIGWQLDAPKGAKIIDAGGRYITPGLVDMVSLSIAQLPDAAFACRR